MRNRSEQGLELDFEARFEAMFPGQRLPPPGVEPFRETEGECPRAGAFPEQHEERVGITVDYVEAFALDERPTSPDESRARAS